MRKRLHLYVLFLSLGLPLVTTAQTRSLSLDEALELAKNNNLPGKSAEVREKAAQGAYRMMNSVFLPGLSISQ